VCYFATLLALASLCASRTAAPLTFHPRLKVYPHLPHRPSHETPLKYPATTRQPQLASYNSPATTRQLQLAGGTTVGGRVAADGWRVTPTSNAFTSNAPTSNAPTNNAPTSNALTSNAFTSNAPTSKAFTRT
jgi:hypothetical protein